MQAFRDDNPWHIGQQVRIIAGPFKDMIGEIYEIDTTNKLVRITIDFFGRPTPVELAFSAIEAER